MLPPPLFLIVVFLFSLFLSRPGSVSVFRVSSCYFHRRRSRIVPVHLSLSCSQLRLGLFPLVFCFVSVVLPPSVCHVSSTLRAFVDEPTLLMAGRLCHTKLPSFFIFFDLVLPSFPRHQCRVLCRPLHYTLLRESGCSGTVPTGADNQGTYRGRLRPQITTARGQDGDKDKRSEGISCYRSRVLEHKGVWPHVPAILTTSSVRSAR